MRRLRNLILTIVAGIVTACADGALPSGPSEQSPSFQVTSVNGEARRQQLKQLLAAEKARIKEQRDLGKAEFEAARAEWKAYRQELKLARKLKSGVVTLLRCEPRPFDGDAAIIGPDGGTLHIGEHELVIPRGALAEEQLIVGEAPTSSLVDVEFSPEGLVFQRPARLTLSYHGCDVPLGIDLRVAYLGSGNRILEWQASEDLRTLTEVVGEINHFSRYAVAY
jgi:hypothetical protein